MTGRITTCFRCVSSKVISSRTFWKCAECWGLPNPHPLHGWSCTITQDSPCHVIAQLVAGRMQQKLFRHQSDIKVTSIWRQIVGTILSRCISWPSLVSDSSQLGSCKFTYRTDLHAISKDNLFAEMKKKTPKPHDGYWPIISLSSTSRHHSMIGLQPTNTKKYRTCHETAAQMTEAEGTSMLVHNDILQLVVSMVTNKHAFWGNYYKPHLLFVVMHQIVWVYHLM